MWKSHDFRDRASAGQLLLIRDLQNRIRKLEDGDQKTLVKRMTTSASTGALVLGLVLTTFTLYQEIVVKPRAERITEVTQFNQALGSVVKTRLDLEALRITAPQQVAQVQGYATSKISSDLSSAKVILLRSDRSLVNDKDIGIAQLIILVAEALDVGDFDSARFFLDVAKTRTNEYDYMKAQAKRYEIRYAFMKSNPASARSEYESTLPLLKDVAPARAWLRVEYAYGEFNYASDCGRGVTALQQAARDLNESRSAPICEPRSPRGWPM